jgi:hypothetical protein
MSCIACKIKLKRINGEVIDAVTALEVSPTVNQAIDAPDGNEMIKAKVVRVRQLSGGEPLALVVIAVEIS